MLPPKVKTHDFKKGYRILYLFKDNGKVKWRLLAFNTSQTNNNNYNKAIHSITLFGSSYISYYLFFLPHKSNKTTSTTNWLRARNFTKSLHLTSQRPCWWSRRKGRHLIPSTKLTSSSHKTFHFSYMKFLDEMFIKVEVSSIFKEKKTIRDRMSRIRTRSIRSDVHLSNP